MAKSLSIPSQMPLIFILPRQDRRQPDKGLGLEANVQERQSHVTGGDVGPCPALNSFNRMAVHWMRANYVPSVPRFRSACISTWASDEKHNRSWTARTLRTLVRPTNNASWCSLNSSETPKSSPREIVPFRHTECDSRNAQLVDVLPAASFFSRLRGPTR